jgi:hypothetical protein
MVSSVDVDSCKTDCGTHSVMQHGPCTPHPVSRSSEKKAGWVRPRGYLGSALRVPRHPGTVPEAVGSAARDQRRSLLTLV